MTDLSIYNLAMDAFWGRFQGGAKCIKRVVILALHADIQEENFVSVKSAFYIQL